MELRSNLIVKHVQNLKNDDKEKKNLKRKILIKN